MPEKLKAHIQARLDEPSRAADMLVGDHSVDPAMSSFVEGGPPLREAAVLVPLVERKEGLSVLLTRRADHLNSHAGQISFPGGRVEDTDSSPIDAALRESEEEVGLDRSFVTVSGILDTYSTGSGYRILPVVGFVREGFSLKADAGEVAEIFEVRKSVV